MKRSKSINFLNDLKDKTVDTLRQHGVKYHKDDDVHRLLIRLFSFQARYISQRNRTVLISKELTKKLPTLRPKTSGAVQKLKEWTEHGVNINSFQSRGLYGSGGNKDFQNSLYGTVHLHLSADISDTMPEIKKNRFSKRSDQVLIALFQEKYAYFIDVMNHPEREDPAWTSKSILQILKGNWPDLIEPFVLKNAALCVGDGTNVEINDEELFQLTSCGINTMMAADDGVVFAPNGGVSSNGTSTVAVIKADRLCNEAQSVQKQYEKHRQKLRRQARDMLIEKRIQVPHKSDVHFEFFEELGRFAVFNRTFKIAWDYKENRLLHFPEYSTKQIWENRK